MPEFHTEAPQATVSEGLAQDPYVAARAGVEPMTLRTLGVDSNKAPPRPTKLANEDYSLFFKSNFGLVFIYHLSIHMHAVRCMPSYTVNPTPK